METLCDKCGRPVACEVAVDGRGEWKGAVLCPDCAAKLASYTEEVVDD